MSERAGESFASSYPRLHHFLETVLRPQVDGDNLLELLHRVMAHWHPTFVAELVDELGRLTDDEQLSDGDLAEQLTREVDERYRIADAGTARAVARCLAEYAAYLYGQGLRGTDPATASG
jgi:hypothetical protein